ncbi:MAG: protein-export chaperone SecB [Deltaproteobacteria bacterium]|nr:protein-export chaperone SecB [Deltaproteobacteria bacterium]
MAETSQAPLLRLVRMYVKDLSFENPGAPQVFREKVSPQADLNLQLRNRKIDADHWEVAIELHATVRSGDRVVFIVEVEHAGLFQVKNVPEKHMGTVLAVDCPTQLFPFTRQIVSQVVVDGGFPPFLLDPVNFLALYRSSQKPQEEPEH